MMEPSERGATKEKYTNKGRNRQESRSCDRFSCDRVVSDGSGRLREGDAAVVGRVESLGWGLLL